MTIETPNEYFPILILIPLFSGLIIGGIFNIRNSKGEDRFFIPFFSGFGISIIIIIIYGGIITEYTSQVMELINNEPCEGLPKIAVDHKTFKEEVVDEVVLRCLVGQDDTVLAQFVRENQSWIRKSVHNVKNYLI